MIETLYTLTSSVDDGWSSVEIWIMVDRNLRAYRLAGGRSENPLFEPGLVIAVGAD